MNGSIKHDAFPPGNGHNAQHFIELLRSLADPIRLRILRLLETHSPADASKLSVGELAEILKLPQSTVSRHLKVLGEAGLVDARRDGTSTFTRLAESAGHNAALQLRQIARGHLETDPQAKNDVHRLAAVLRKREPAGNDLMGKHAPHWDQLRAQWFGDTFHLEGMLALMNPAWTIADIGTGTGAMLPLISPHVHKIIAVEPSAAMLKVARTRIKNCKLANIDIREGVAEQLPIDKAGVDVALVTLVLAYASDPLVALKEIRRILKPGGILLILDLQAHNVELFREKLGHRHMGFSQEQLSAWLTDAGFTATRWHPLSPAQARAKESSTPVPDLFVLRAEAA